MSLWWNDSLVLIMDREDVKILREMDFIARSLISKNFSKPQSRYEKRISQIRGNMIYDSDSQVNRDRYVLKARYI
jgi:hypothetical protein